MAATTIAWADESWNCLRATGPDGKVGWHCVKIDPACAHCYAAAFNKRGLRIGTGLDYVATSPAQTYLDATILRQPLDWKRPKIVFPCSMTDWVGEFVDPRFSAAILALASLATRHVFLFLTKRPHRLAQLLEHTAWHDPCAEYCRSLGLQWRTNPVPNVWLGYSAGTQKTFDRGLPFMDQLAGAGWNTWCSCEPMLERVHFRLTAGGKRAIKWVVIGGESGNEARSFSIDHLRESLAECDAAGVPVFVKQLGRRPHGEWGSQPAPFGSQSLWFLKDSKGEKSHEWPADLQGRRVFPFTLAS